MNAFILVVVTYLGGSAWGPQVTMQEFSSQSTCAAGKNEVMKSVELLNASNLIGGQARFRKIVTASCIKK